MKIGVLALQGAFIEHIHVLTRLRVQANEIRLPADLRGLDGIIIPGGESTTMMNLMNIFGLAQPLKKLGAGGMPIWGTCAGMICLGKAISNYEMDTLALMDITTKRNAFGRQVDSFETALQVKALKDGPFPAVFIRAPWIEKVRPGVVVLARLEDGTIVAARQKRLLVTSFHPELSKDTRFHRYFVDIAAGKV